ncbi:GMC oxidoreductase, partial [Hymenopellis radicata]
MLSTRLSRAIAASCTLIYGIGGAAGQLSSAYTDSITGISFQALQDDSGLVAGFAFPGTIGTDFIGQILLPLTDGEGWGGISLGGTMTSTLLLVMWGNGDEVMTSFREASAYATPAVYSGNATVTLSTIPDGTYVNDTHVSLTYLCGGCITGDSLTFSASDTTAVLGYAYASTSPTDVSDAASDLTYHSSGFGEFGVSVASAQSADYDTWAALAVESTGGDSGNATTSGSPLHAIVVGGGIAGIIVAERMAEAGSSVLLIERGTASLFSSGGERTMPWNDTVTIFDLPANGYLLSSLSDTSYYCTDTASQAGCVLGGGSMVNALMWVKPQSADFENWPAGWSWDNVSASADKLYERNPGTTLPSADGQYYDTAVYDIMSTLLANNSWTEVDAVASPEEKHNVYSHPPWNIQDSQRAGPVRTYLPLAQSMDNFELMLDTKVTRVVRTGSTITGVEIETNSTREIINLNAGGKVVLAAGALSTPRLLFNSGIGPSDQIFIVQSGSTAITLPEEREWIELPVGKVIKDHPIFSMKVNSAAGFDAYDFSTVNSADANSTDTELYDTSGSGILSQSGQRLNFWTSVDTGNSTRYIQGTVAPSADGVFTIKVYLTHGLTSSGSLGITASGNTELTVQPWLTTDDDKETITTFLNTLLGYIDADSDLSVSGDNVTAESILDSLTTGSHWVASCLMGESNDGSSVVDTDTRVWGTDNLFIADASIHPDLPTGNTQAIVAVVAEKAAERIIAYTVLSNSTSSTTAAPSGTEVASSSVAPSSAFTASSAAISASVPVAFPESSAYSTPTP